MDLSNVVPIAITATASFVGAWLAARFALYRFYKEKVWERKAAAYTAIFEALHDMEKWFDAHISARRKDHEIPDDETERMGKEYRAARDLLERRLAAESWLLPDTSRTILNDMSYRLAHQPKEDWLDMLFEGNDAIFTATNDLRNVVRADLGLRQHRSISFLITCWRWLAFGPSRKDA